MPEINPQPFQALAGPVAPLTWEVRADLDSAQLETGRIPIEWSRPVEILGMYASIIQTGDEQLVAATLDDILVLLDSNRREQYTARLERATTQTPGDQFVTLSAMTFLVPRALRIRLTDPAPDAGVNFRWEMGADYYDSCRIKLAFFCNYITP